MSVRIMRDELFLAICYGGRGTLCDVRGILCLYDWPSVLERLASPLLSLQGLLMNFWVNYYQTASETISGWHTETETHASK